MSRKKAREAAVMLLYHWDMMNYDNGGLTTTLDETITGSAQEHEALKFSLSPDDTRYIEAMLACVKANLSAIDAQIEAEAVGWKLDRLPKVDLAILRLGVGELLHREDIPGAVTINECVELAKQYSTEHSGTFINGVLSTILKKNGGEPCRSSE